MSLDKTIESNLWNEYINVRSIENRNKLIVFYNSLVKLAIGKLINNYNKYIDYDDLLSCGILGLIDAVEKFDFKKDVKFETYASIRIRGTVIDQLRKQDWLPSSLRHKVKKIEKAYSELENQNGRIPNELEVAEYLSMDTKELKDLLEASYTSNVIQFDDILSNSILKNEKSNAQYEPEYNIEEKFLKELLAESIDALSEKERMVISLYYYDELTLKEIGVILGVSESRVSQIHSKVLIKLKSKMNGLIKVI